MKNLTGFFLAGYSGRLIWQFVLGYGLMLLNSFVVVALPNVFGVGVTVITQAIYLGFIWYLGRHFKWVRGDESYKFNTSSLVYLSFSWLGMILVATLLLCLSSQESSNQVAVLALLRSVPLLNFILNLVTISILEEMIYRGLLFGLSGLPLIDVILTSMDFTILHHPNNIWEFLTYFLLGLFLGNIRYQKGIEYSILLHLLWNMTALTIALI